MNFVISNNKISFHNNPVFQDDIMIFYNLNIKQLAEIYYFHSQYGAYIILSEYNKKYMLTITDFSKYNFIAYKFGDNFIYEMESMTTRNINYLLTKYINKQYITNEPAPDNIINLVICDIDLLGDIIKFQSLKSVSIIGITA